MKETKFIITANETGQKMTRTLTPDVMRVFNTRWTSDKDGKHKITKAKLEQTVYFHMDVEGFKKGAELHFKLFEYDDFLGIDWANKDDYKFPEEEIVIETKVIEKNNKRSAFVELKLDNSWQPVIKDDLKGDFSNLIELYWKVFFILPSGRLIGGIVPEKTKDMLKVGFSDRDLYFNPPIAGNNLPEFVAYDGSPMVIMEFVQSFGTKQLKKQAKNFIKKGGVDKIINKIALAKLEKGTLVTNQGGIYTKNTQIYTKDIFTNDGNVLKDKKIRKNFGYRDATNKLVSTKPISQYDYFSKTGKRVTLLRTLKKAGSVYDFFSIASFMTDEDATSKPLPIPLGGFAPITAITNLITKEQEAIFKEFYNNTTDQELLKAKSEGLNAVRKYINSQEHNYDKGFDWRLMSVSNETANQLLNGKFNTFKELKPSIFSPADDLNSNVVILYKEHYNSNKENYDYIIETIFIDE